MQVIHDALVGAFVLISGALISRLMTLVQETDGFADDVLGPMGALALALIVIGFLMRYLHAERAEAKEIQKRLDAHKDREGEQKDRLIEALRAEIRDMRGK